MILPYDKNGELYHTPSIIVFLKKGLKMIFLLLKLFSKKTLTSLLFLSNNFNRKIGLGLSKSNLYILISLHGTTLNKE